MSPIDFEVKKQTLLMPFYAEAGAALAECQTLEYGIGLLLHHFSRVTPGKISLEQTVAIMENEDKKTLGQLILLLQDNFQLSDEIEDVLRQALQARNTIIHRFIIDNTQRLPDKESRQNVIKDLKLLRVKVRAGDDQIRPLIEKYGLILDGFDSKPYLNGLDELLS